MDNTDSFIESVPWEIRSQILRYHASQLMSDSERAPFIGLPKSCRIREGAKILSIENLVIGENNWIGENAILDASGGLEIGSNNQIGLGVYIWSHDSHRVARKGLDSREHRELIARSKTVIGSNCFIAGPSVIMPGVTIGDNCIITPMSVVYDDLKPNTIYKPYKNMYDKVNLFQKKISDLEKRIKELENNK